MQARFVAIVAVLWSSIAIATVGAPPDALSAPPLGSSAPPFKDYFSHEQHVSKSWLGAGPEVFRDCRGCHRFSAANVYSTPQAECDNCHTGGGLLHDFAQGWQTDLSGYRSRTQPAFRHHTHGMLECRACHEVRDNLLDHLPIRTGPGQCAGCHDDTVTAAEVAKLSWFEGVADVELAKAVGLEKAFVKPVSDEDRRKYAETLKAAFGGVNGGINVNKLPTGGRFDHADHIDTKNFATKGRGTGIDCTTCHTNIEKASAAEVGTGQIPVDGCKECHRRDENGSAARDSNDKKHEVRELWSLGTFAHADHFGFPPAGPERQGVCNEQGYTTIEQLSCKACHLYDLEKTGSGGRDFLFERQGSRHRFGDCLVCHDSPAWDTGETEAEPLHSSTGGGVRNGWGNCLACHVLGEPDMTNLRPKVQVQRWDERTFLFEGHTHPDITSRGVQRAGDQNREQVQDCKSCHRALVPELPTRLIEKVFRHDTHLPKDPAQANCVECHPLAEQARSSATLSGADYRTYTLSSCKRCHWGGEVTERIATGEPPLARQVVSFPHGPHVQKHGQTCAECHELAEDGRDYRTKPKAAACNQCHDHVRGENDSRYEGLFDGKVQSCVRCHHEQQGGQVVTSIPPSRDSAKAATDARYRSEQSVFAGFRDSQFHPLGMSCSECHKANLTMTDSAPGTKPARLAAIEILPLENHLRATKEISVHAPPPKGLGQSAPPDCLRCHWKIVGSWDAAAGAAKPIDGDPADARQLRLRPDSPETRARYGNWFDGYPGTDKAKG